MLKYMSYLYANVRKKWSTYLIPVVFVLLFGMILITQISSNNENSTESVINKLTSYYYILPFLFGAMFIATKALNIFKDGESDGTELLIVSKPISRGQIVLGKFLTLYSLIFAYCLWTLLVFYILGSFDKNSSSSDVTKFAFSLAIGSFIIMMIFSSIIAFFASVFGKIGTMTLSIAIPAILPIASLIIASVGRGQLGGTYDTMTKSTLMSMNYNYDEDNDVATVTSSDPNFIYDDKFPYEDGTSKVGIDANYKKAVDDKQNGWYKYPAYFDAWQHMQGFYSVFQGKKEVSDQTIATIEKSNWNLNGIPFIVNNEKYQLVPKKKGHSYGNTDNSLLNNTKLINDSMAFVRKNIGAFRIAIDTELSRKKHDESGNSRSSQNSPITSPSGTIEFNDAANILDDMFSGRYDEFGDYKRKEQPEYIQFLSDQNLGENASLQEITPIIAASVQKLLANDFNNADSDKIARQYNYSVSTDNTKSSDIIYDNNNRYMLFDSQASDNLKNVNTLVVKKYVSTSSAIIVYILLGIAMSGFVIFKYFRRDFK